MALANYEGKAFRNGEHWHEGCDAELPSGDDHPHTPHAVVGDGSVRVGVYKTTPMLYQQRPDGTWACEALHGSLTVRIFDDRDLTAVGVIPALGGPAVAVLAEPDGTVWTAVGAYEPWNNWCEEDWP